MPDTSHFLRDYNWLEENKPEDVRFGDIVVLFFLVNVDIVVLFFSSNLEVFDLISLVRFNSVILTADHDVLTPTALQQLAQLHHKVMFLGENIEEYFLGLHFGTNKMKSSLPYQLLLYLGSYFFACFLGIELLLLIYKTIILPYKSFTLFSEVNIFKSNGNTKLVKVACMI